MLSLKNSLKFFTRKNLALVSKIHNAAVKEEKNYEEVRIPVPWGHIAGKWWGPQDKRPIFVIHGWQVRKFIKIVTMLVTILVF